MNKPALLIRAQERYESLETRQRVLVALVLSVLILLIFNLIWFVPQESEQATLKRELSTVQNQRKELLATLDQRNQQMFERRIFVAAFGCIGERVVKRSFEVLGETWHGYGSLGLCLLSNRKGATALLPESMKELG